MGQTFTKTQDYSSSSETIHYSQVSQQLNESVIYQCPPEKYHTRYLHKVTFPYYPHDEALSDFLNKLKLYGSKLDNENLYYPVRCEVKSLGGTCQQQKQMHIYYQIYDFSLRTEILARQRLKEMFSEEEVWYILYSVLNGLRQFERLKIGSGGLRTGSVRMNDAGHVKILNCLSVGQEDKLGGWLETYYDEKLLEVARHRIKGGEKKYIPSLTQTFALGVVVLEVCTFIDGEQFYNKSYTFNENMFKKAFFLIEKSYSPLLKNLVGVMLSRYEDRPLPSQIYDVFSPFKKEIFSLEKFNFDNLHLEQSLKESTLGRRR